ERQADRLAISSEAADVGGRCFNIESSADHAGGDEGRGFGAVNVFKGGEVGLLVLGFEVDDLAADHAVNGAGGMDDFPDDGDARLGGARDLRQHLVCLVLQGVSGKDGDGLAESFVAGTTPTAQAKVIERRQVVVN